MLIPDVTARILPGPMGRLAAWAVVGLALVCGVVLGLTGTSAPAMSLAVGGYGVAVAIVVVSLRQGFPHPTLGLCNVVTMMRLALTAALMAPLTDPAPPHWAVFCVALVALGLDGADGWLARREGRVSDFGARFDMEVDAALALILALNAWAAGTAGGLVLALGLPRYVFVGVALVLPWLNGALPDRISRKAVCVVQIGALIVLQLPALPQTVATVLVGLVAAALIWSFGRDIVWLWRNRA